MHLKSVTLHPAQYPVKDHYPFDLPVFSQSEQIVFDAPVTLFVGENGTGKSTLIQAIARACGIHIWQDEERKRAVCNPYEDKLSDYMSVEWVNGPVEGSFSDLRYSRILSVFWTTGPPCLPDSFSTLAVNR